MQVSRRKFIGLASALGLGAIGAVGTGACGGNSDNGISGEANAMSASTAATTPAATWQEMDQAAEAQIKAFPAKTAGLGGQPLPYQLDGDVKVFELVCQKVKWEVAPGQVSDAMTYNGVTPGPEIRVTEGDRMRVIVRNELDESTSVHWHGMVLPNDMDGVAFLTQPPIEPGKTFTYEFVAKPAGTHMYHSHHNAMEQVSMGMLGALIVEPKDPTSRPAFDREYTIVINDGSLGLTLNGKSFPATQPLVAKRGEKVLIRYMNEGMMLHPMHLHGMPQLVIAKDGYLQPQPWLCDTITVAPGERWETIVDATEPGTWAFHCHILPHAESDKGMVGMVTALIVNE